MQSDYAKQGKTAAIVAYLSVIGTIIAFFMNHDDKNEFASFHIRQGFGLWVTFYIVGAIANIFNNWIIDTPLYIGVIILIIYGLVTAIKEEQKEVPILGKYFQEWFTFIR
ncbi:hypothetical protein ACFSTE_20040 [Aquimarina hainanensis]|uniref:Chloroplast import component protein (Tic20) n=1 Tax=Aquimarina hainanensis TaxID=1578017 RepID=A0ABW5NCH7_9FLAO|nr:hypothetical protein [Aquimarina sp. TRL1]QKX06387.1 hypothetical protein HN014_16200 [Aquimarina sp. TRL1]